MNLTNKITGRKRGLPLYQWSFHLDWAHVIFLRLVSLKNKWAKIFIHRTLQLLYLRIQNKCVIFQILENCHPPTGCSLKATLASSSLEAENKVVWFSGPRQLGPCLRKSQSYLLWCGIGIDELNIFMKSFWGLTAKCSLDKLSILETAPSLLFLTMGVLWDGVLKDLTTWCQQRQSLRNKRTVVFLVFVFVFFLM